MSDQTENRLRAERDEWHDKYRAVLEATKPLTERISALEAELATTKAECKRLDSQKQGLEKAWGEIKIFGDVVELERNNLRAENESLRKQLAEAQRHNEFLLQQWPKDEVSYISVTTT